MENNAKRRGQSSMNQSFEQSAQPQADRLFVALEIPQDIKATLSDLQSSFPGLRWTPTSNLHLTLRFIGLVQQSDVELIRQSLRLVKYNAFHLVVAGLGLFRRKAGGILWAGVRQEEALLQFKQQVDAVLRVSAGLHLEEASFTPHLTLSRLKTTIPQALKARVQEKAAEQFGAFHATSFTLFRSILRPAGAIHEPVERYPMVVV